MKWRCLPVTFLAKLAKAVLILVEKLIQILERPATVSQIYPDDKTEELERTISREKNRIIMMSEFMWEEERREEDEFSPEKTSSLLSSAGGAKRYHDSHKLLFRESNLVFSIF